MRFRFCCTCDDEERPKTVENRSKTVESPQTILSEVITQQPKNVVEPIQLESVEESSIQVTNEEPLPIESQVTKEEPSKKEPPHQEPIPVPRKIEEKQNDISTKDRESPQNPTEITKKEELLKKLNMIIAEQVAQNPIPSVTQPYSTVKQTSDFSVDTTIDGEKLTFCQIAPDLYRGTFKGSQFHIIQDQVQDDYFVFTDSDKAAIKVAYNEAMKGMQRGLEGLQDGLSAFKNQEAWNLPSGSSINTNYITRRGENAKMTFKAIDQGHFRSSYEGKEFTILNGRLLADESFDAKDRELILQTYNNTLLGMQQGLLGMQQRMQMNAMSGSNFAFGGTAFASTNIGGSSAFDQGGTIISNLAVVGGSTGAFSSSSIGSGNGLAFAHASYNLATGRESLKRIRSLNHGKRVSLLEGGPLAQPRQPVMVIEDISDEKSPKKPRNFDDIDGSILAEPVLQKTTFTPQAIIYDDPKTYEAQDKNELPLAKRLDEYIISLDENYNSENRYHFHQARPKRVIRRKLSPKDKFRLESPEKYCLFEEECLKLHNQYRKMHGVPPLVHNEFLSQVAKEWAEHLALKDAFYHRPNNEYGENLYYVEGIPCRAKMAVKAWYDEIDLYDYANPKFSKEVGHFTQLVWKDTREVGTGVAQIGNKVWVCCNYHPPGNYSNQINDEFVPRPIIKRVKNC